jgi:hypothetical protein
MLQVPLDSDLDYIYSLLFKDVSGLFVPQNEIKMMKGYSYLLC